MYYVFENGVGQAHEGEGGIFYERQEYHVVRILFDGHEMHSSKPTLAHLMTLWSWEAAEKAIEQLKAHDKAMGDILVRDMGRAFFTTKT